MKSSGIGFVIAGIVFLLLSFIPLIGSLLSLVGLLFMILGIIWAVSAMVKTKEPDVRAIITLVIAIGSLFLRFAPSMLSSNSSSAKVPTESGQTTKEEIPETPPIEMTPKQLYSEFEKNKVRAEENYNGKKIRIAGKIKSIDKDDLNDNYVVKLSLDADVIFSDILCRFSFDHSDRIKALNVGDSITIIGDSPWMNISSVDLKNCIIDSKK